LLDGLCFVALSNVAVTAQRAEIALHSLAVLSKRFDMVHVKSARRVCRWAIAAKHALEMVSTKDVVTKSQRDLALALRFRWRA